MIGDVVKFEIELDEAQVQALSVYGERYGLTPKEMVRFAVLSQIDAAILSSANPGSSQEEWMALQLGADGRLADKIKAQRVT